MGGVSVLIPWRPGCPHREAALAWVLTRYAAEHPTWQVCTGTCPSGPWVKALAVAAALDQADGDLLVVADADVWTDHLTATTSACDTWAMPHGHVRRLNEASTGRVLVGAPIDVAGATNSDLAERPYRGRAGGGVVVLRRDLLNDIPLDRRFVGWGQEDEAWAAALTTLAGRPVRLSHPLWHLWHPPQPRLSRSVGSNDSQQLYVRYCRARRNPDAMRELVAEMEVRTT